MRRHLKNSLPFPRPPTHLPSSALLVVHSPSLTSAPVAPSSCSCAKFSAKRALSLRAYMLSGRMCSTLHCSRQFGSTDVGDSEGAESAGERQARLLRRRETQDIVQTQREKRCEWVCDRHCRMDRG